MTDEDYQFNVAQVQKALTEAARTYPLLPGLLYTSPFDFVAQHGTDYRPVKWRGEFKQGAHQQCYGNALVTGAWFGMRYVEGFTLAPTGALIPHAWNLDTNGELIDVTWCNTGLVYIGCEFSLERADDAVWTGDACVLNDEHRNYPIFQQRWSGEDFTLTWPCSDRLESLQANRRVIPASIIEFEKRSQSDGN